MRSYEAVCLFGRETHGLKARKLWGVREDAARVKIVCSVVRLKE
jgi:hypothetical protein